MPTLRNMKIFLEVCRSECNMSKAARKLYLSQPAVTVAIRDLEAEFGVRLFDRINHRLCLTEAGKEFCDYCRQTEALLSEMNTRMMSWETSGRFRVGASITIGSTVFPEYIRRFSELMPEIELRVKIVPSRELVRLILARELDLALIETPVHNPAILARKFYEDNLDVIAPPGRRESGALAICLAELARFPLLLREKGSGSRDILENALASQGLYVDPIWEAENTQALLHAVACGMGYSVIPHLFAGPAAQNGSVIPLTLTDVDLRQNFYLIRLADKSVTKAMKTFENCCAAQAGNEDTAEKNKESNG